jgi:predicted nucleic acid-binding protein
MNAEPAFFDTNILIYANSAGETRQSAALTLLLAGGRVSVQVLNEFVAVSRRKRGLSWYDTLEALRFFQALLGPPQALRFTTHMRALQISQESRYHIYDSLIIASALEAKCSVLYSEDLQDGHVIGPLTIRNPFR